MDKQHRQGQRARARSAVGAITPAPMLVLPGFWLGTRVIRRIRADLAAEVASGRLALWLPVLFACGLLAYFGAHHEPSLMAGALAFTLTTTLAIAARSHWVSSAIAMALAAFFCGFLVATAQTARIAHPVIAPPEGPVRFIGYVESRERRTTSDRIVLWVVKASGRGLKVTPQRVRLSLPRGSAPPEGTPITQLARILPPLAPAMPGSHDFGRAPWFDGIGAVGFGLGGPQPARIETPPPWSVQIAAVLAQVRRALAARIRAVLTGPSADIAVALVTGERASIAPAVEDSMRVSGLTHVLSISGLHMAMVGGTLFALVRGLLALSPVLALRLPIKSMAAGVALAGSAAYLALSGNDEPAQRSFIMAAVVLLGILVGRPALNLRSVAVAAMVVLAAQPVSVLDPGTQMSFAATLALVAAFERARPLFIHKPPESLPLRLALKLLIFFAVLTLTSLVAGLATAPFAALHFQRLSPYGLLANLLATPAISLLVMPFGLAGVLLLPFGWDRLAWPIMGFGIDVMMAVSDWVASLPSAGMRTDMIGPGCAGMAALALCLVCLLRGSLALLAVIPAVLALGLAGPPVRFDVLIGPDARTVAVRMADGRLAIAGATSNRFLAEQWLSREADGRVARDESLASGFSCDRKACAAALPGGGTLVLVLRAHDLQAVCASAMLIVTHLTPPIGCSARILTPRVLAPLGTIGLIRQPDGTWREIASRPPGVERPWLPPVAASDRPSEPAIDTAASRDATRQDAGQAEGR